ncbi:hypothetical protein PAMP_020061 [Pampus punctatissimus]
MGEKSVHYAKSSRLLGEDVRRVQTETEAGGELPGGREALPGNPVSWLNAVQTHNRRERGRELRIDLQPWISTSQCYFALEPTVVIAKEKRDEKSPNDSQ